MLFTLLVSFVCAMRVSAGLSLLLACEVLGRVVQMLACSDLGLAGLGPSNQRQTKGKP